MSLRAASAARSALTRRSRSNTVLGWAGLGLALGVASQWQSITRGLGCTLQAARYIHSGVVTPRTPINSRYFSSNLFSSTFISDKMAAITPPQPAPTWTHTPEQVLSLTKAAIEQDRKVQDAVAALAPKDCDFSSVSTSALPETL